MKLKENKVLKNASWLIACRIAEALINLVVSMLTTRYLGPANYGVINYAMSVTAFVLPLVQLGLNVVLVQEITEHDPDEEGKIIGTSLFVSFLTAILSMIGIFAFVSIADKGETETIIVCVLYSTLLLCQVFELLKYWFQAKYLSKYVAVSVLISYVVVSVYKIYLLISGKDIYWFAISRTIEYFTLAVLLTVSYYVTSIKQKQKGVKTIVRLSFSFKTARRLLSKSKYYMFYELINAIYFQIDRIMLKNFCGDEAIGYYSAAVTCAAMFVFVFTAIIDSARPLIFESHQNSFAEFEKNTVMLYSVVTYLSVFIALGTTLFAPLVIRILYGVQYSESARILQIVTWYPVFSYLGQVRGTWILATDNQKYLWAICIPGAIMSALLNYMLIPVWGAIGAATAMLLTQIFSNVIVNFFIPKVRHNNLLMLRGLNAKPFIGYINRFLNRKKES